MTCGICGRHGGKPFGLQDGRTIGATCGDDLCGALLWESRVMPPADVDEQRQLAWRIRKHVAAVRGRHFGEPNPVDADLTRARLEFEELKRIAAEAPEGENDAVPGV